MSAVVTDADLRNVVAGIRALGRGGAAVLACGPTARAAGIHSRHALLGEVVPPVTAAPVKFSRAVATLASGLSPADGLPVIVHPGREEAIDALLGADPSANLWRLPWPRSSVRLLRDKAELELLAGGAAVRTPAVVEVTSLGTLRERPPFPPCVLKPRSAGGGPATVAKTRQEVAQALAAWPEDADDIVVQEHVDGALISLGLIVRDGTVVAEFQHRALETWPRGGGTVARAIGEAVDPAIREASQRLLVAAGHEGFAQVQFLCGSGPPALIDVNCGFPGSLPLALRSGVNLPRIAHGLARGEPTAPRPSYRPGAVFRWLEADLMATARGEVGAIVRRPSRRTVGATWDYRDPMPSLLLSAQIIRKGLGRRAARSRSAR
jgi:predicted ATP-grasp superfamily ATP-dependent carboligase